MLGWARLPALGSLMKTPLLVLETIERNANSQAQLIEDILDVSYYSGQDRLNRPINRTRD